MNTAKINNLINIVGIENYREMLASYERALPTCLAAIKVSATQKMNLHSLKSMSYAVGLEDLGNHMAELERIINNGASATAQYRLTGLDRQVAESLQLLKQHLKHY